MNEYQFVLPYPPSVNTYWRRRGSQYYISDKGQKYRKDVQQIIRQLKLDIFTKSRLRIKVIADVPDYRRRDLDNILKGLLDSLIHAGFAEDDEQFDDIRVIRGVKVPGGRLEIKITELENARTPQFKRYQSFLSRHEAIRPRWRGCFPVQEEQCSSTTETAKVSVT